MSLDSLALRNDVMQQQLDSISQGKRKHPAFLRGVVVVVGRYFGSLLNLLQRLEEVVKKNLEFLTDYFPPNVI